MTHSLTHSPVWCYMRENVAVAPCQEMPAWSRKSRDIERMRVKLRLKIRRIDWCQWGRQVAPFGHQRKTECHHIAQKIICRVTKRLPLTLFVHAAFPVCMSWITSSARSLTQGDQLLCWSHGLSSSAVPSDNKYGAAMDIERMTWKRHEKIKKSMEREQGGGGERKREGRKRVD